MTRLVLMPDTPSRKTLPKARPKNMYVIKRLLHKTGFFNNERAYANTPYNSIKAP